MILSPREITVPDSAELTNDFGRIAVDFKEVLDAVKYASQ